MYLTLYQLNIMQKSPVNNVPHNFGSLIQSFRLIRSSVRLITRFLFDFKKFGTPRIKFLLALLFFILSLSGFGQELDSLMFKHYNHNSATQVVEVDSGRYAVLTNETKVLIQLDTTDYPAITYVNNYLTIDTIIELKESVEYYSYPRSMVEIEDTLYVVYEYLKVIQGFRTCVNLGLLKVGPNYTQLGPFKLLGPDTAQSYAAYFSDLKPNGNQLEFMMIQNDSTGSNKVILVRFNKNGNLSYRKRWTYSSAISNPINELMDYEYVGNGRYLLGGNNKSGESYMLADTAFGSISLGYGKALNLGVWNIEKKGNEYLLFGLADGSAPGTMEHKGRFSFWKIDSVGLAEVANNYYKLPDTVKYFADIIPPIKNVCKVLPNGDYLFAGDEFYQTRNQFVNPFSAYTIRRVKPDGTMVWKYSKVDSISGVVAPVTELIECSDGDYLALRAYTSSNLHYNGYTLLEKFEADGSSFSISEEVSIESLKVFPNPVTAGEEVHVLLPGLSKDVQIKLYSMAGEEVYLYQSEVAKNWHILNLPDLSIGEYVLKIVFDGNLFSKVLLIKN